MRFLASSRVRARASQRTPVLFVGPGSIEWWLDSPHDGPLGLPLHLEQPFADLRPDEVVETALATIAEQGAEPKTCILALSPELAPEAVLRLPELSPSETKEVLARRAVQVLQADPADTLYYALPLAEDANSSEETENGGRAWLLYLQRRSLVLGLELELRRRGIETVRAVAARSAFAACAGQRCKGPDQAYLFVGVEHSSTVYGLGIGDRLLLQSVLETGLGPESPTAVLSLVQELRNLGAWWRKRSRGEGLQTIVTIGLEPDLAASMEPALRAAFGAVEFDHVREPGAEAMMARVSTLAACRVAHPLIADWTQPLPVRTQRLALAALVSTLICTLIAFGLQQRWKTKLEVADNDLAQMRYLGGEAEQWSHSRRALSAKQLRLEAITNELELLGQRGIPLEALLTEVDRAFVGDAHLSTLTVGEDERGFRVQISGSALGDEDRAGTVLSAVERSLSASKLFAARPRILPPTALPSSGAQSDLVFSVEALLQNRAAPSASKFSEGQP